MERERDELKAQLAQTALEETEKEVVVRAEMPGFEPEEIEVLVRGDELLLRAAKKVPAEKKEAAEKPWRRLERVLTLPPHTNPEKVEALYHNGVLEVHLPKTEEALPKRVPVKGT